MPLLQVSDYPSVRRALDVTFNEEMLPDIVIGDVIYAGAAELEILAHHPTAASYLSTSAEAKRVRIAAILLTASKLAPAVPMIVAETTGNGRYQREIPEWNKLAAHLAARAEHELGMIDTTVSTVPFRNVKLFRAAKSGRGAIGIDMEDAGIVP